MMLKSNPITCILSVLLTATASLPAFGWGQTGHDVTCEIASRHLTPKAKKQISLLLDGRSLVYWANWMDNASHTPEYAYTSTWHYKNIDASENYENAQINPKGDVVTALDSLIIALSSGNLTKERAALSLKMLIHFAGDIHCPMHMGHKSDLGGNRWQVQYFGKGRNLHSVFDSGIVESGHRWSYTEWADQLDILDRKSVEKIAGGTPEEWGKETWELATRIYDSTPQGSKLSYDYVSTWLPEVEKQLLYGGLRLAGILNGIFK